MKAKLLVKCRMETGGFTSHALHCVLFTVVEIVSKVAQTFAFISQFLG